MTHWFTSDTHFGHTNIIKYCNRPFKDAQEMDEILIQRWNEVVKPSDHLYHLGDVTMGWGKSGEVERLASILSRLNGKKRLILGNHDQFEVLDYVAAGFEKVKAVHRFANMWFTHIPIHPSSMSRCLANIHGHTHEQPNYPPIKRAVYDEVWDGKEPVREGLSPYINICVEHTNYRPISLEEIQVLVRKAIN